MRIGLTYDLRDDYLAQGYHEEDVAEFDSRVTTNGLTESLAALGFEPIHIGNIYQLVSKLAAGERWDFVFNIAEGLYGFGRESQVPALLDAYQIPYTFSDPAVLGVALHKATTKQILQQSGVPTPHFLLVHELADLEKLRIPFPLFAKPVAEGTGKGVSSRSRINNMTNLKNVCKELLNRFHEPVLVEEFLPGREFTVGIMGHNQAAQVLGVIEIEFNAPDPSRIYSFHAKENYESTVKYHLRHDAAAMAAGEAALAAWRALGCRDAGRVDVRFDAHGVANVIELNPLAGLNPIHSDLPILCRLNGIDYTTLIAGIMEEATNRCQLELPIDIAIKLQSARQHISTLAIQSAIVQPQFCTAS